MSINFGLNQSTSATNIAGLSQYRPDHCSRTCSASRLPKRIGVVGAAAVLVVPWMRGDRQQSLHNPPSQIGDQRHHLWKRHDICGNAASQPQHGLPGELPNNHNTASLGIPYGPVDRKPISNRLSHWIRQTDAKGSSHCPAMCSCRDRPNTQTPNVPVEMFTFANKCRPDVPS